MNAAIDPSKYSHPLNDDEFDHSNTYLSPDIFIPHLMCRLLELVDNLLRQMVKTNLSFKRNGSEFGCLHTRKDTVVGKFCILMRICTVWNFA